MASLLLYLLKVNIDKPWEKNKPLPFPVGMMYIRMVLKKKNYPKIDLYRPLFDYY